MAHARDLEDRHSVIILSDADRRAEGLSPATRTADNDYGERVRMKRALFVPACLAAVAQRRLPGFPDQQDVTRRPRRPIQLMTGPWASIASATTLTNTCTDFHWTITEVTGTSGTGTFTAKCMGTIQFRGYRPRHVVGYDSHLVSRCDMEPRPAERACPISLTGTATFDGTQFRVPYTGTTCLGPVSGTEILRKG